MTEKNTRLEVDCMQTGSNDIRDAFIIDPVIGKRQQVMIATQLSQMVFKVNVVIISR
jgi:T-complex protein 1 subunit epsilon